MNIPAKYYNFSWAILLWALTPCLTQAQTESLPPSDKPQLTRDEATKSKEHKALRISSSKINRREQLEVIEQFIDMPPEKIANIRKMLEQIEKMTPEQRQAYKQKIQQLKAMPTEKRRRLFNEFQNISVEERMAIRNLFKSLSSSERKAARRKFKSMTPEARKAYIEMLMKRHAMPSNTERVQTQASPNNTAADKPAPHLQNVAPAPDK